MKLSASIEQEFRLNEKQKKALKRLGIFNVKDLLFHFPTRYSNISKIKQIKDLEIGEMATVYGKVSKLKTKKGFRSKIPMGEGEVEDLSGRIKIVWFRQAYLAKMLKDGENVKLTGKVTQGKNYLYIANPEFEKTPDLPIDSHRSIFQGIEKDNFGYPIYHETRGLTSKWIYHAILKIIKDKTIDNIEDYIPEYIIKKYNLPSLKSALLWIHKPRNRSNIISARKRFAFEEILCIQLERQRDKLMYSKNKSYKIKINKEEVEKFIKRFPFEPTKSQKNAIEIMLKDLQKETPMSRLLEGDVGSGKTAVAGTLSYAVTTNKPNEQKFGNLQVAYMAPTEILAIQHFESFISYFKHLPINIGLITGSGCRKFPSKVNPSGWTNISRSQLLKWTAEGIIPILIGTHTLIQKTVKFKNLSLVIIDEQHRFGVSQRKKFVRRDGFAPHLLSMTATPIPRTLALTIYGDLDLTLLDEMPIGRKPVITEIITPDKREDTYEKVKKELKAGRQVYVICPRIFEANKDKELSLNVKSTIAEAKRLKREVFKDYEVGILHSKMSKNKKEETMKDFKDGKINILCATSVVEVGVNIPNATVIIIEGAERFGLAQLHQLRGRVIRSEHQAYCYIFTEAKSEKTIKRLKAIKNAKNSFELAELDLLLRGAGELGGEKQWGMTDLGMEAIKNIKMVEAARAEAIKLIEEDSELKKYPLLKEKVKEKVKEFHFE